MRYANSNLKLVKKNYKLHDPRSPILIGDADEEVVKEIIEPSYIDSQQRLMQSLNFLLDSIR